MEELLLKMYQYLVRYGKIEVDKEYKFEGDDGISYHRITVYYADKEFWIVTIFNGQVMGIKRFRQRLSPLQGEHWPAFDQD